MSKEVRLKKPIPLQGYIAKSWVSEWVCDKNSKFSDPATHIQPWSALPFLKVVLGNKYGSSFPKYGMTISGVVMWPFFVNFFILLLLGPIIQPLSSIA